MIKSKSLCSFAGWKKRKFEQNEVASGILRSKIPSNKELCVTLLGGEDKIVKKDHVDGSGKQVWTGWTVGSNKKITWIGGNGWTNPKNKLGSTYGSEEAMYDTFYAIKTA